MSGNVTPNIGWTAREPKNPLLRLTLTYILVLIVFVLYSWLVSWIMAEKVFKGEDWERINVIGPLFAVGAGVVIVLLSSAEIEKEKVKARLFIEVVNAAREVVKDTNRRLPPERGVSVTFSSGKPKTYTTKEAAREITLGTNVSILLLLWEFSSRSPQDNDGRSLLEKLGGGPTDSTSLVAEFDVTKSARTHDAWGIIMLETLANRAAVFVDVGLLLSLASIIDSIKIVNEKCNSFIANARTGPYWWIHVVLRVASVIILISVPWMLWSTAQGYLTIAWSAGFFVIFYSIAIYRMVLADVMLNPTKWDMTVIMQHMISLGALSDHCFSKNYRADKQCLGCKVYLTSHLLVQTNEYSRTH